MSTSCVRELDRWRMENGALTLGGLSAARQPDKTRDLAKADRAEARQIRILK